MTPDRAQLQKRHHNGSGWFGTIAVLSLLNSLILLMRWTIVFPVGLGTSSFAAAFLAYGADKDAPVMRVIGLFLVFVSAAIIGAFWICRLQARKGRTWAYLLGLVIYALDALVTVALKDYIALAFHAWGLYSIWLGYAACRRLLEMGPEPAPAAAIIQDTPDPSA